MGPRALAVFLQEIGALPEYAILYQPPEGSLPLLQQPLRQLFSRPGNPVFFFSHTSHPAGVWPSMLLEGKYPLVVVWFFFCRPLVLHKHA